MAEEAFKTHPWSVQSPGCNSPDPWILIHIPKDLRCRHAWICSRRQRCSTFKRRALQRVCKPSFHTWNFTWNLKMLRKGISFSRDSIFKFHDGFWGVHFSMVFRHSKVLSFGAPERFPYDFDRGAHTSSSLPSLFYLLLGLHGCSRFYKQLCVTQYQELGALQLSIEMFRHILR